MSVLSAWTEILPLFVVRWLALRMCERVPLERNRCMRRVALARRDVYILEPLTDTEDQ